MPVSGLEPEAQSNARSRSLWLVLLSSVTCWLIACLGILNWSILELKPLKYIKTRRYVPLEQNPLVSKLPAFFDSKERHQLLVLGSSLPMEAIARYDAKFTGRFDEKNLTAVRTYTGASYLEHLIKEKSGSCLKSFNLTCVACMASDAELILRRAIEAGRSPKIIIYAMAPRDFIDNVAPPIGKSPVGQLLSNRVTLPEIFSRLHSEDETRELLLGQAVYLYKVRGDYKTMLTGWACDLLSHPANLRESQQMSLLEKQRSDACGSAQTGAGSSQFADLPQWKERYCPANFDRFAKEKSSFQNMLAACKQKQIRVIVVNMPLTEENKKLIPADLVKLYKDQICKLPAEYGAEMLDLDAVKVFDNSDFYDSAHVNAQGGKKVQDLMVSSAKTLSL